MIWFYFWLAGATGWGTYLYTSSKPMCPGCWIGLILATLLWPIAIPWAMVELYLERYKGDENE